MDNKILVTKYPKKSINRNINKTKNKQLRKITVNNI